MPDDPLVLIESGVSRRGRGSQEDPAPVRQVNTPSHRAARTQQRERERDGGGTQEDWRTMTCEPG